jgi:MFS family permease
MSSRYSTNICNRYLEDHAMPALISEDGRWWWDGTQWRTRLVEDKPDLFWFTTTPEWFNRIVITGLIGLIPIVGAINMLGWALTATDMHRSRWKELPPAGFQHLERGVPPFVVSLVYGVVLFVVIGMVALFTVVLAMPGGARLVMAIGIAFAIFLVLLAWWLFWLYLFAALLIVSDKLGIAKALDPRRLLARARANHEVSLHAGLVYGAGTIVLVGVASIIPFAGLFVSIVLPALYAVLVPSLAAFRVEVPAVSKTGLRPADELPA